MKKEDLYKVFKICDYFWEIDAMAQILEKAEEREEMEFELTYYYDGIGSERGKKILEELLKCILNQIKDSGLYKEFIRLGMLKEHMRAFINILKVETEFPISIARQYIEEKGFSNECIDLVIATGDREYIKEIIEKYKLTADWHLLANLVAATKESKYIQRFIENDLGQYFPEYSKRVIGDSDILASLIAATKDDEYILKCLENPPFDIWMGQDNNLKLILAMQNIDLAYECMKKYLR